MSKQRLERDIYTDLGMFNVEFYYIPLKQEEDMVIAPTVQLLDVKRNGMSMDFTSNELFYIAIETAVYEVMEDEMFEKTESDD